MNQDAIREAKATGNKFEGYTSETQIEGVLRWAIIDAMNLKGQTPNDSTLIPVIKKLREVIIRDYPRLTDKEFELILEAGISGELGRETWVSGATILYWLRLYQTEKSHIAVLDEQEDDRKEKKRLSQSQIAEMNEKAFERAFHQSFAYYKEKGTIFQNAREQPNDERAFHLPQWAAQVYQHYRELGQIPAPTDAELELAEQKASNELAKGNPFRLNASILKVAREDWRDSFLLEFYYSKR